MLTDLTCGIDSVMRRRPLSRTSRVTMRVREPLTTCMERNYRRRLQHRCYHAPPLSCNRRTAETPIRATRKDQLDAGIRMEDPDTSIMPADYRPDLAEMDLVELEQALESMGHP